MLKLTNPTDVRIQMTYLGTTYSVDANSSEIFPDAVANHWKTMVHQFVTVSDPEAVAAPVVEAKEEVKEVEVEVKEEKVEKKAEKVEAKRK